MKLQMCGVLNNLIHELRLKKDRHVLVKLFLKEKEIQVSNPILVNSISKEMVILSKTKNVLLNILLDLLTKWLIQQVLPNLEFN